MKPIFTHQKEAQMFQSPYSLVFNTNFTKQYTYCIEEQIKMRQSRCPLTYNCGIPTLDYTYNNNKLMNCGSTHLYGWILSFLSKI